MFLRPLVLGSVTIFGLAGIITFISLDWTTHSPAGFLQTARTDDYAWHETQANSFTSSTQSNCAIDVDKKGNTVVVWDSRRQQQGTYGVYLQRFDATGAPLNAETQVNLYTRNMQMKPAVAIGEQGTTWVAWESFGQDGSMGAIIARKFDVDGFTGGDEILVNQSPQGHQTDVVVTLDSAGTATFVWATPKEDGQQQIVARRFDSEGKPSSDEFVVTHSSNSQKLPSVATDHEDNLIVTWAENRRDGTPTGIQGKIFDASGTVRTAQFEINANDIRQHIEPSVSASPSGHFAVAWLTAEDDEYAAYVRVFDTGGKAITEPVRVTEPGAKYVNGVAVAASECDKVLVSWNRQVNDTPNRSMNVEARIINLDGSFAGAAFRVNRHNEGRHRLTAASGKQRIVWTNERMFFAWNGSNEADKSAANLTVRTSGSGKYQLKTPEKTAVSGRDVDQTVTARPHEPPTYDPRRVSREAWGGDPNPVPGPGSDFGFIGMTNTGWNPPDPSLAVGPDHLVGMTNGEIAFFDKNGNVTFSDEIENSFGFWGSLGTDNFVFDPEVIFDPHSQRFIAMACERSDNNRSNFLLAISDDDNPNGNWNKYRLDVTSLAGNDIDSPNLGVDDQAVYLTADFFGPDKYLIYMLDKNDLINGEPNPLARSLLVTGSQSFGIPVMYDAGAPAFYMIQALEFGTYSTVRMHAVTDPLGSPSRFITNVSVPSYGHPQDPPQQGTSSRPELFEARFWSCVYRNGSLWAVHHQSPNSSGTVRARWYQFDMNGWPTSGNFPVLVQSGDIFPGAGIHTFFPSIWVDGLGNAAITCARSGVNEFISMCRTVRHPVDPAGTFQTLDFVRQSNAPYNNNRWGDYSGTMNDPSSPGTFWGMHEYTPAGNSWNTWIGQYVIESVTDVPVESYDVIRGNEVGGDISSLVESDDDFLEVLPGLPLHGSEPPIWIEFETTSPADQPVDLIFALEAKANTPDVEQVVEVIDFNAGSYLQVDARPATTTDSVVQIPLPGDVTRFVDTDGTMQARVGWAQDGLVLFFPWKASIDHVFWTVTE